MSTNGKESGIPVKDLWEITIKEIKDPVLLAILAVGLLILFLPLTPQGESYKWPMTFLGVLVFLAGMAKWAVGVVLEHGRELELSELSRHLRSAKSVRTNDMIQVMGQMIMESSEDPWMIDKALRLANKTGGKTGLSDISKLYEEKGIQPSDARNARKIVQSIMNHVSLKRTRIFRAVDADDEQLLQYPSTMLLSEEIYGGCADKVVLLGTLLRALKFQLRLKYAPGGIKTKYHHVWAEVSLPSEQGNFEWIPVDPYVPGFYIGEKKEWDEHWNKRYVSDGFPEYEKTGSCNLD